MRCPLFVAFLRRIRAAFAQTAAPDPSQNLSPKCKALARSNVAKVSPFPRKAQVILHKSVDYLGTGTPICRRQFFRMPAGGKFLLHKKILGNLKALLDTVNRLKPSAAKGAYMLSMAVSTTMGPGFKVDMTQVKKFLEG